MKKQNKNKKDKKERHCSIIPSNELFHVCGRGLIPLR